MLVYDTTSRDSFISLDNWLSEASKYGANPNEIPIALCANKVRSIALILTTTTSTTTAIDLYHLKVDKAKTRQVSEEEGREFADSRGLYYFETSAQSGSNVSEMIEYLFESIMKRQ